MVKLRYRSPDGRIDCGGGVDDYPEDMAQIIARIDRYIDQAVCCGVASLDFTVEDQITFEKVPTVKIPLDNTVVARQQILGILHDVFGDTINNRVYGFGDKI